MIRFTLILFLVAFGGNLGCGGGSGGGTQLPPLTAPANLKLDGSEEDHGRISLTWNPPSISFDGYQLEASVNDGPYVRMIDTLIPKTVTGIVISWQDENIPEVVPYKFRICLVRGNENGPNSEASYKHPIFPPSISIRAFDVEGLRLAITSRSKVATQVRILRGLADDNGNAWSFLELEPLAWTNTGVIWIDASAEEHQKYIYKVCLRDGTVESKWIDTLSPQVLLKSPADFQAQGEVNSVRLTWKKPVKAYDSVVLKRQGINIDQIAIPAGASEFVDNPSFPGMYRYQLTVRAGNEIRNSPEIIGTALNPPGNPNTLKSPWSGPPIFAAVYDANRNWICASQDATGRYVLRAPAGHGWAELPLESRSVHIPPFGLGSSTGHHRFLYSTPNPSDLGKFLIKAVWFEKEQWQSEEVGSFPPAPGGNRLEANFALTPGGDPIISLRRGDEVYTGSYLIGKVNGTWALSPLYAGYDRVFQDSSTPMRYGFSFVTTSTGAFPFDWTTHLLNIPPMQNGPNFSAGNLVAGNQFWTCWEQWDGTQWNLYSAIFRNGAWSQPEVLLGWKGYSALYWMAGTRLTASPDGRTLALIAGSPLGLVMIHRTGSGPWSWASLGVHGYPAGCEWTGNGTLQLLCTDTSLPTPTTEQVLVSF